MRRRKMSKYSSKKVFRKNTGVHKLNRIHSGAMRGGIRL